MPSQPDVLLFTDGACSGNPGPGGWAVILRHPATGTQKRASGGNALTTNNQMELTAVIEGLKMLKAGKRCSVRIVSDSEYVIRGLTEWVPNWISNGWMRKEGRKLKPVKNVELWKELYALTQAHEVTFEHVRGHTGHPENEECDRMAVAALQAYRV